MMLALCDAHHRGMKKNPGGGPGPHRPSRSALVLGAVTLPITARGVPAAGR